MSTATHSVQASRPSCWCCGNQFGDDQMVHLGAHPEVAVCAPCARFLHRQAHALEDQSRRSPAAMVGGLVRGCRAVVMDHGWQDRPVMGRWLRRIDRFLP